MKCLAVLTLLLALEAIYCVPLLSLLGGSGGHSAGIGVGLSKDEGLTLTQQDSHQQRSRSYNEENGAESSATQSKNGQSYSQTDKESRKTQENESNSSVQNTRKFGLGPQGLSAQKTETRSVENTQRNTEYQKNHTRSHNGGQTETGEYSQDVDSTDENERTRENKNSYSETKSRGFGLGSGGLTETRSGSSSSQTSQADQETSLSQRNQEEYVRNGDTTTHRKENDSSNDARESFQQESSQSSYGQGQTNGQQGGLNSETDGSGQYNLNRLLGNGGLGPLRRGPIGLGSINPVPSRGPTFVHNDNKNYASQTGSYRTESGINNGNYANSEDLIARHGGNGDYLNKVFGQVLNNGQYSSEVGHHLGIHGQYINDQAYNSGQLASVEGKQQGSNSAEYINTLLNQGIDADVSKYIFRNVYQGADSKEYLTGLQNHGGHNVQYVSGSGNRGGLENYAGNEYQNTDTGEYKQGVHSHGLNNQFVSGIGIQGANSGKNADGTYLHSDEYRPAQNNGQVVPRNYGNKDFVPESDTAQYHLPGNRYQNTGTDEYSHLVNNDQHILGNPEASSIKYVLTSEADRFVPVHKYLNADNDEYKQRLINQYVSGTHANNILHKPNTQYTNSNGNQGINPEFIEGIINQGNGKYIGGSNYPDYRAAPIHVPDITGTVNGNNGAKYYGTASGHYINIADHAAPGSRMISPGNYDEELKPTQVHNVNDHVHIYNAGNAAPVHMVAPNNFLNGTGLSDSLINAIYSITKGHLSNARIINPYSATGSNSGTVYYKSGDYGTGTGSYIPGQGPATIVGAGPDNGGVPILPGTVILGNGPAPLQPGGKGSVPLQPGTANPGNGAVPLQPGTANPGNGVVVLQPGTANPGNGVVVLQPGTANPGNGAVPLQPGTANPGNVPLQPGGTTTPGYGAGIDKTVIIDQATDTKKDTTGVIIDKAFGYKDADASAPGNKDKAINITDAILALKNNTDNSANSGVTTTDKSFVIDKGTATNTTDRYNNVSDKSITFNKTIVIDKFLGSNFTGGSDNWKNDTTVSNYNDTYSNISNDNDNTNSSTDKNVASKSDDGTGSDYHDIGSSKINKSVTVQSSFGINTTDAYGTDDLKNYTSFTSDDDSNSNTTDKSIDDGNTDLKSSVNDDNTNNKTANAKDWKNDTITDTTDKAFTKNDDGKADNDDTTRSTTDRNGNDATTDQTSTDTSSTDGITYTTTTVLDSYNDNKITVTADKSENNKHINNTTNNQSDTNKLESHDFSKSGNTNKSEKSKISNNTTDENSKKTKSSDESSNGNSDTGKSSGNEGNNNAVTESSSDDGSTSDGEDSNGTTAASTDNENQNANKTNTRQEKSNLSVTDSGSESDEENSSTSGGKTVYNKKTEENKEFEKKKDSQYEEKTKDSKGETVKQGKKSSSEQSSADNTTDYTKVTDEDGNTKTRSEASSHEQNKAEESSNNSSTTVDSDGNTKKESSSSSSFSSSSSSNSTVTVEETKN